MQQKHRGFEDRAEFGYTLLTCLAQLDPPVAKLTPQEAIEHRRNVVEAVLVEIVTCLFDRRVETAEHIAPQRRFDLRRAQIFEAIGIEQQIVGGVVELVGKVAALLQFLFAKLDVASLYRQHRQSEAKRIGGVLFDHNERIDDIAARFGHLVAVLVFDQGVQIDIFKGQRIHHTIAHHQHARHPEEEDIKARNQQLVGIELLKILFKPLFAFKRFAVTPAQGAKGPKPGTEPGIEHIGVLVYFVAAARFALCRCLAVKGPLVSARIAIHHGDAVPPPELSRDTPVAQIAHPCVVAVDPMCGEELRFTAVNAFDGARGKLFFDKPLLGDIGFDDIVAAVAVSHLVAMLLDLFDEAFLFKARYDLLARFQALKSRKLAALFVEDTLFVEDGQKL